MEVSSIGDNYITWDKKVRRTVQLVDINSPIKNIRSMYFSQVKVEYLHIFSGFVSFMS